MKRQLSHTVCEGTFQNGETINGINNKFSSFNFIQSELSLAQLDSDVIKVNKIQETSTLDLINCLKRYFNINLSRNEKPKSGEFIIYNNLIPYALLMVC